MCLIESLNKKLNKNKKRYNPVVTPVCNLGGGGLNRTATGFEGRVFDIEVAPC